MADYAGETFVSNGIRYILQYGPKGNLRPYTVGPVKACVSWLPKLGWLDLGLLAVAGVAAVVYMCLDEVSEK